MYICKFIVYETEYTWSFRRVVSDKPVQNSCSVNCSGAQSFKSLRSEEQYASNNET